MAVLDQLQYIASARAHPPIVFKDAFVHSLGHVHQIPHSESAYAQCETDSASSEHQSMRCHGPLHTAHLQVQLPHFLEEQPDPFVVLPLVQQDKFHI